jgi:hypothetical protein
MKTQKIMEVAVGGDYDSGDCDSHSDNKTADDFPPDEKKCEYTLRDSTECQELDIDDGKQKVTLSM